MPGAARWGSHHKATTTSGMIACGVQAVLMRRARQAWDRS